MAMINIKADPLSLDQISDSDLKASVQYKLCIVRSEVLMAVSMKMAVFWVVAPCSLV
jgi:hypothetical protein